MNKKSYLSRVRLPAPPPNWLEAVMNFIFFLCGMLAVGCVVLISVYMVLSGVPAIHKIGLFRFPVRHPVGFHRCRPGVRHPALHPVQRLRHAGCHRDRCAHRPADGGVPLQGRRPEGAHRGGHRHRAAVGIPSVVFGLLGMQVLVPAVAKTFGKASGACLLTAIVVLAVTILPALCPCRSQPSTPCRRNMSRAAWPWVPPTPRPGSRSACPLPSGIAAGIVLGIGRAIGEAMAVMMVAGNSPNMPDSVFRSVTFLTTAIAKEMSYAGGLQRQALFSIALVLFVFIMIINVVLNVVLKGGDRDA